MRTERTRKSKGRKKTTKVEGTIQNIIFQNADNGYTIAEIVHDGKQLTVVGSMPLLCVGELLSAEGAYISHPTYGKQFSVTGYSTELPTDANGIRLYLGGGILKGIGIVIANRITEKFGERTFEVLCTDPDSLAKVKGINPEKARKICKEFNQKFSLREAIVQLTAYGLSVQVAISAYNAYGASVTDIIRSSPYQLCNYPVLLDFMLADKIARQFAFETDMEERIVAGLFHVVRHNNNNGHTCMPQHQLLPTVSNFLGVEPQRVEDVFERVCSIERLKSVDVNERRFVFQPDFLSAEREIAARLLGLVDRKAPKISDIESRISTLENLSGITYETLQKNAIIEAMNNGVFVLTGGPGTGKTTAVNAIISLLEQSAQRTALVAPTGRAAKRMTELCSREATTIHRLLEVNFNNKEELTFVHNEKKPLKVDVVVVDEMSMVDIFLFVALLRALPKHARLIIIGDKDQLPSVGPGNILRSIIMSGKIPTVSLVEIFRQSGSSLIVRNAHRILRGEQPTCDNKTGDYYFLEQSGERAQRTVLELVSVRLPKSYGYNSLTDIQVLCATKVGPLGTVALNIALQNILNPPAEEKAQVSVADRVFRVGDKVMQTRNNYDLTYQREDGREGTGVFNGDIGYIKSIDKRRSVVEVTMDDRVYRYSTEQLIELEHAYAITVHKSQGSEFTAVIMPLCDIPRRLCYRNLLYTGVTRARELLVTVGERSVISDMLADNKSSLRYSLIGDFLNETD